MIHLTKQRGPGSVLRVIKDTEIGKLAFFSSFFLDCTWVGRVVLKDIRMGLAD